MQNISCGDIIQIFKHFNPIPKGEKYMIPISFSKPILKKLHQELQVAYLLPNINLYRTIQALIWYGEGKAAAEIAEFLHVTSRTIYP